MSPSVIAPTPWWMTLTRTSRVLDLRQLGDGRLDRAADVALEDHVQILDRTLLQLGEEGLERDAALGALRERLGPQPLAAPLRERPRFPLVLDHARELAGRRRRVEAEDLDRRSRPRLLDLLAAVVVERAHLAVRVAGDDRVAHAQRAAVHEHRRDRPATDVETGLDDRAGRLRVRVRGQLELGVRDEQHLLEQVVQIGLLLRRDVRELDVPAPVLRLQALGGQVGFDAVRVRIGHVHLVDGDHDRDAGRARVRDRFLGLRHDAVVRGDDENGDVGHLRSPRTHGRERLVAGCVEEGDLPPAHVGLVGADVLRDPACLGLDHGGLANRVQQRRLAVVDVTHDRDDRRPRREVLGGVLEDLRELLFVGRVLDRDLAAQLSPDQLDLLVGERLRDLDHLAEAHHDLDDLRRRDAERLREVADGNAGRNGRGAGGRDDLARRRLRAVAAAARLADVARTLSAALDDDPALTSRRSLAGPDRTIGLVRFVSHQCSILVVVRPAARARDRRRRSASARG